MTHPAATFEAVAPGSGAPNVYPQRSRDQTRSARHPADAMKSTFYDRVEILLEMRRAPFHYSVIDGDARIRQAPGHADCHLLNDDVSASSSRGGTAGAWRRQVMNDASIRSSQSGFSNRYKKDLCR
jgi:hypothetical protein